VTHLRAKKKQANVPLECCRPSAYFFEVSTISECSRQFVGARCKFLHTIDVARASFAGNFSQPMSKFVAQKIFYVAKKKKE
jgi:hypothetical protein